MGWKLTRGFPYGSVKISLLTYVNQTYFYIPTFYKIPVIFVNLDQII